MSNAARALTDEATSRSAVLTRKGGTFGTPSGRSPSGPPPTSSSATCSREAKGESSTSPAIDGSRAACMTADEAPIDRPHSAMAPTPAYSRSHSIIVCTSSRSKKPSEMYSPSEWPHPAKSNEKSAAPSASTWAAMVVASARHDALPCRYTTHGKLAPGCISTRRHRLPHNARPRLFGIETSCRTKLTPPYWNSAGPRSRSVYCARGGRMMAFTSSS
mmetsp:Transcript_15524/g.50689  ORF Transcript_15524/g.50689 Transcript_15524/m.50689 type:complete len:217 (+) Transcript_15524:953-1603(+)